jgi:hypothetical protein
MTAATPPRGAPFMVRRSRFFGLVNLAFGILLAAFAAANLWSQIAEREGLVAAGFFALLAASYVWHAAQQLGDRRPQIVVDATGLLVAAASPEPIPWPQIWRLDAGKRLVGGARVEAEVAPEVAARLKLGHRYLGDNVVRLRGRSNGFAIFAMGYDRSAAEIVAATKRYWPPDTRE